MTVQRSIFLSVLGLALTLILSGCYSYKRIPYFQDLSKDSISTQQLLNFLPVRIQPNDILGINVTSLNPEASNVFNYNLNRVRGNNDNSVGNPVTGYLVDHKGQVNLPLVGAIAVGGLTTSDATDTLQRRLTKYLKDPVVNIRIINFKISVLGDVLRPNVYTIENEKINIIEALSLAGDLNITAVRKNILLIRETSGRREFIPVDLTSKEVFESPFFYLKNNDVIYVQPDRVKDVMVDRRYRNTSLIISGLSVLAIVLTNLYR